MEETPPIQNNNDPGNSFMGNEIGRNSFMREDADHNNPAIRDESKGPGMAKRFARPVVKEKPAPEKPSFFRGRNNVTTREILWKLAQPDAYKNLWGGKSLMYKDKMKALAEKHFTKGQYEHYTKAELNKITRAIEKEINKEGGTWQSARKDMIGRVKDIIN
jgi:1,4-alpha-glucan branching enzyme